MSCLIKKFLVSFSCLFFIITSCLGQDFGHENNHVICIDSLDFCIASFSPKEDMCFYSSKHLNPSSVSFDLFINGLRNSDMMFVLYNGAPEDYMTLAYTLKHHGVQRFRMVDYLQQISVYLYHQLNDEWRVLRYRDQVCISNNDDGVVEVAFNSRNGSWNDKSIYSFNWDNYREESITSPKELVRLCEKAVAQYYLSAMIHKKIDALLLSSTSFTFYEPLSRTIFVDKDSTIPIRKVINLNDLYFFSRPGSNNKYITLLLESDKKDDRVITTVLELDNSIVDGRIVVDISANNLIELRILDSMDTVLLQRDLLDLPFEAVYIE